MPDESRTYNDLQPGDTVLIQGSHGASIRTVERVTKTQIIIDNATRFNRNTGREVGGVKWESKFLSIPTPKDIEQTKEQEEHARLVAHLRKHPWGRRSLGALREIREILLRDIDA